MLFCRETSCMSVHPCRAHHKLKWARKGQSGLEVLYELIPRSESSNAISAENSVALQCSAAYPNSARSTLFDRGWQQPLDHPTAQPARRVKDAEGTAKPLVLDSVRWLCYPAALCIKAPSYLTPKISSKRGGTIASAWNGFRHPAAPCNRQNSPPHSRPSQNFRINIQFKG